MALAHLVRVRILAPQLEAKAPDCSTFLSGGRTSVRSVPRYDEQAARAAVAASLSYSEALRKLGLRPAGGNHELFRKYVDEVWKISTEHFDPARARTLVLLQREVKPLSEILIERSSYSRRSLKHRLYE